MRRLLLPTLSGVLYFLSWIGFGIWPLAFVCFVPLLWILRNATPRQALWLGAWMGFVTHLGGYTWIMHVLRVFAFAPPPLAFLGYLLVCVAQGFLFGVMSSALVWVGRRTRWPATALLPLALVATEFAYPLLFQSYTGVALMPLLPLVQIADLGGPLILSALQAVVNGALFDALEAWLTGRAAPLPAMVVSLIALVGSASYGYLRLVRVHGAEEAAPKIPVGLAQPNVGEVELHANPMASVRTLQQQTAELHARGASLVVWPEVGYNVRPLRPGDTDGRAITGGVPVAAIVGVIRVEDREVFNSAVMIDESGRIGDHYDKIQLLAFGEYIPGGEWFPQLYQWSPLASHLTRGRSTAPLRWKSWRFATFICYEDILPGIVRSILADEGQGRAHAMVNLTNDSWYGAGHEQEQHLMLAAVRSIEHRRWLLRATSTGISAFVDSAGRVVQRIERNQRGVALTQVPMLVGTTPYAVLGDWPGWVALSIIALVALREAAQRRKQAGSSARDGTADGRATPRGGRPDPRRDQVDGEEHRKRQRDEQRREMAVLAPASSMREVARRPRFQKMTETSWSTPGTATTTAAAASQARDFTALRLPARPLQSQPDGRCRTPGVPLFVP
jgi:apolipoprotein N-acyltransferase